MNSPARTGQKSIQIVRRGRLGNQMFQYMFARTLQAMMPDLAITGVSLPQWGIETPEAPRAPGTTFVSRRGHRLKPRSMLRRLETGAVDTVLLQSVAMRLEYYTLPRETYRAMFGIRPRPDGFGDEHIVINVRAGDTLDGVHPDYGPLPFSFFRRVIGESGRKPVFMGEVHGDHPFYQGLRESFPEASFLPPATAVEDFLTIVSARHIVLAPSSFSWLAGWFSEAETIVMPLAGIFDPARRPDVDLNPIGDVRYRCVATELGNPRASREPQTC